MDVLSWEEPSETNPEFNFATVGGVYDDGLSLIFDGSDTPSEKHYKCNASVKFTAGDRVKILADSGTYVVEYVVGFPAQGGGGVDADTLNGKTESQLSVLYAQSAGSASTAGSANTASSASTASTAENANNASKLGGKTESNLSVASAVKATNVVNQYMPTSSVIQFYGTGSTLRFRVGTSGNWINLT